jgi:Helix-turn-helix domain of resolvase
MILMDDGRNGEVGADAGITTHRTPRSRRLRDRFSSEDLQAMIDLYRSGTTAGQVAEKFSVSLRSVKRLLREHQVRREGRGRTTTP